MIRRPKAFARALAIRERQLTREMRRLEAYKRSSEELGTLAYEAIGELPEDAREAFLSRYKSAMFLLHAKLQEARDLNNAHTYIYGDNTDKEF